MTFLNKLKGGIFDKHAPILPSTIVGAEQRIRDAIAKEANLIAAATRMPRAEEKRLHDKDRYFLDEAEQQREWDRTARNAANSMGWQSDPRSSPYWAGNSAIASGAAGNPLVSPYQNQAQPKPAPVPEPETSCYGSRLRLAAKDSRHSALEVPLENLCLVWEARFGFAPVVPASVFSKEEDPAFWHIALARLKEPKGMYMFEVYTPGTDETAYVLQKRT